MKHCHRVRRALAICAAAGVWMAVGPAAAQLSNRDAACRYKVAQATRNYSAFLVERSLLCHKQRMRGRLPAAIDCNDPTTWAANGFSRGVFLRNKDRALLARKVNGCRPDASLAALGYASCPAPCDGIAINGFADLADCVLCLADDCVEPALTSVFGTTPLPAARGAAKCVERAGRHLGGCDNPRAVLQQNCHLKKDRGYAGSETVPDCGAVDDPSHPFSARMAAFRAKKSLVLEKRCADVDVAAETDTCGNDAATLVTCTNALAEACADQIFPQVFP